MMFLRSTVEKRLPVLEDERQLSDEARELAFRGSYMYPSKYVEIKRTKNLKTNTQDNFPHKFEVVRETNGGARSHSEGAFTIVYKEEKTEAVSEINSEEGLNRINRVERASRRIKAALIGATAVLGLSLVAASIFPSEDAEPTETDKSCETVADGTSLLIPLDSPVTLTARDQSDLGVETCQLNDVEFEVFRLETVAD